MHIKEIDIFRVLTCCSYFVIYFAFLFVIVMNQSAYGESVESISFFIAHTRGPIFVFTMHISPQIITVIKRQYVTKITSQLDRCMATAFCINMLTLS